MGNKLYVGNLPYSVRDAELGQAFAAFGSVVSAKVMMERDSGRSKGFGFVEMGSDAEAQAAIEGMHDKPLQGRNLVVNEARPMEPRPPRASLGGGRRDAATAALAAAMTGASAAPMAPARAAMAALAAGATIAALTVAIAANTDRAKFPAKAGAVFASGLFCACGSGASHEAAQGGACENPAP